MNTLFCWGFTLDFIGHKKINIFSFIMDFIHFQPGACGHAQNPKKQLGHLGY